MRNPLVLGSGLLLAVLLQSDSSNASRVLKRRIAPQEAELTQSPNYAHIDLVADFNLFTTQPVLRNMRRAGQRYKRQASATPITPGSRSQGQECLQDPNCVQNIGLTCRQDICLYNPQTRVFQASCVPNYDECASQLACDSSGECLQAPGTMCVSSTDCANELSCDGASSLCSQTFGQSCVEDYCGTGLVCDNTMTVCLGANGRSCVSSQQCANSMECDASNTCRNGAGSACSSSTQCSTGLVCNSQNICNSPAANGASCSADIDCASAFCDNTICSPKAAEGQSCAASDGCESGLACDTSRQSPICATSCTSSAECTTSILGPRCNTETSFCTVQSPNGGPCADTGDCSTGLTCTNGTCAAEQGCSVDSDCTDGICVDAVCQPIPPSDSCITDADCTNAAYPFCIDGFCNT